MRCTSCKEESTLHSWEGQEVIRGVEILARGQRCSSCGETLCSGLEMERKLAAVARAIVARGIRNGDEFKFVRKATRFRAADLAELLGVRPETISRWERGEVEVPRTAVFTLGQLLVAPEATRKTLEVLAAAIAV
jgi:putative zinc finger/helix-turn-helix YgiT family protein